MKDYERLKKKYGESFAKFCRANFSTILEEEGKLVEIIESKFAPSKFLYEDIVYYNKEEDFINYIYSFYEVDFNKITTEETPEALLDKAGYKLYKCETNEDVLEFKKYFRQDEELCTFRDPERINNRHIFFAVKKNVDEIKRENFTNPQRQDEYGTSVMSIQFTKSKYGKVSIKNRYNHTVENPDATFSNNLDNIISGLTDSFEKHYDIKLANKYGFNLRSYVLAPDGKHYTFNLKIGDKYYCPNNIIITNNKVKQINKDRYEVFGRFILDLKEKKIFSQYHDGFVKSLRNIEKIEIVKNKDGSKNINITDKKTGLTKLLIDIYNRLISYENNEIQCLEDMFFSEAGQLVRFSAPNLVEIKNGCFQYVSWLEELDLPKVEKIGHGFALFNEIEVFNAPLLKTLGEYSFTYSYKLKEFNTPNLKHMERYCLNSIGTSKDFYMNVKNLEQIDAGCFGFNNGVTVCGMWNKGIVGEYLHKNIETVRVTTDYNPKENPTLFNEVF